MGARANQGPPIVKTIFLTMVAQIRNLAFNMNRIARHHRDSLGGNLPTRMLSANGAQLSVLPTAVCEGATPEEIS